MTPTRIALMAPALALLLVSGCGRTRIPTPADLPIVYKIDVQQGNEVTQDMLAQLQPGMEKSKVRFIMGTPLIVDTFHNDRWDYIYTMQKRGGERVQRRVSLYFRDDKLERIAGDVKPAAGAIAQSGDRASKTVEVPAAEKGLFSRVTEKVTGDGDDGKNKAKDTAKADDAATAKVPETNAPAATPSSGPEPAAESSGEGQYAIDNGGGEPASGDAAPANSGDAPADAGQPAASGDAVMPRFQSESNSDEADTRPSSDVAAEAASGSDGGASAEAGATSSAAGGTGSKSTEVTIPDDAPQPKNKKGLFRRLLEKVGVGDNEDGEYQSTDQKHRDVSNPENQ